MKIINCLVYLPLNIFWVRVTVIVYFYGKLPLPHPAVLLGVIFPNFVSVDTFCAQHK